MTAPITQILETREAEENLSLGIQLDLKRVLKDAEARLVRAALGRARGNVTLAAYLLCISRTTLHEKMRRLEI